MDDIRVGDYVKHKTTKYPAKVFKVNDETIVVNWLVNSTTQSYSLGEFHKSFEKIEYYQADESYTDLAFGKFMLYLMLLILGYIGIIAVVIFHGA